MDSRILVAEDDPTTRAMVAETLSLEGYDVVTVGDGRAALEAVGKARPDLAILDIMMPEQDGMSVLRAIRSDGGTSALPVILLTAKDDDGTTWEGWRAGCNYYMPKPFEPEDLLEVVSRLLLEEGGR